MAITQAMCTSFKVELLDGVHNFDTGGDTFYIALYTSSATLSAATTVYTTSGEITNTAGTAYVAGGEELTVSVVPTSSGTTAYLSFDNVSWSTATFTARGALIYNFTKSNKAVAVLDFGADKTATSGTFTINFPAATASDAIIRIA